jgi:hypothetical protein
MDRIAHTCVSESEKVGRGEEKPEIRNWLCAPRTPPMVTTSRLQLDHVGGRLTCGKQTFDEGKMRHGDDLTLRRTLSTALI